MLNARQKTQRALLFLHKRYPKTFQTPPVAALKVGIYQDIIDDLPNQRIPPSLQHATDYWIKRALHLYCNNPRYKPIQRTPGTVRVNLAGNPSGIVTQEEADFGNQKSDALAVLLAEKRAIKERNRYLSKHVPKKPKKPKKPPVAKKPHKPAFTVAKKPQTKPTIIVKKKRIFTPPP